MIRLGVIGYGYWGPNLVRNCYEAAGAQVACVSDLRADRLALVRSRYPSIKTTRNSRELIENPSIDAVRSLRRSPRTTNWLCARGMMDFAQKRNRVLMVITPSFPNRRRS